MSRLAQELEKKAYHLRTLSDVSQEIFFLNDPKEIIPKLLLMVMGSYGSMQGVAFLFNEQQSAIDVFSQRGFDSSLKEDLDLRLGNSNGGVLAGIDQPVALEMGRALELDNPLLDYLVASECSVFCPLKLQDACIGGLALGAKLVGEPYSADDMELLGTLVKQGAISVQNARFQQQQITQERLRKELEIAASIQLSFLPSGVVDVPGIDVAAFFKPAKEVGGDFYDFIKLPENRLGIVIADVCGKGLPAALHMALTRALIRSCVAHEPVNMSNAVLCTNSLLQQCAKTDHFVTLLFSIYDPATGTLRYVRAGHNPPIFYSKRQHRYDLLGGQGVALGVFSGITLEEREIDLEWGDIVVFYTDGITEAPNAEGEMFGVERIEQLLSEHENRSAHAIAEQIKSSVVEFEGPGRQFDDLTMVLLKKSVSSLYG
ncbi:MAG: SpoIIE family protein phosphatase [Desulfofustis sp.]|nr:SpoIIE family protein phosphatase [Desulfofustis sp.]